ncbi:MAG: hypothetical protein EHM32_03830 [Spirochaetales bacterium]|nr:MAG: hypothetical protein EHM32_03830 [Spirochaetales bacterium]
MTWNIVTLLSCLLILFAFRRLDRSNLKMIKLKRFSSKIFNDFRKLTDTESRRFNDATIEMDLLVKKAGGLSISLRESVSEIETRIKGLDIEKSSLKKVEDDLKVVSQAAREVNKQIEFIAASRAGFGDMAKKISSLIEGLARVERESSLLIQAFNDKVRERSREMGEEIASQVNRLRESFRDNEAALLGSAQEKVDLLTRSFSDSLARMEQGITTTGEAILENIKSRIDSVSHAADLLESRIDSADRRVYTDINTKIGNIEKAIENFELALQETRSQSLAETRSDIADINSKVSALKSTLSDLENSVFADIKDKSANIKREIAESITEFHRSRDSLLEKVETDIEKVYGKLRNVENTVDDSKSKLIASFADEVQKIRTEIDNLSIHSIAKKDEIVKAARREAEETIAKIEDFDEKYAEMENRLSESAEEKMSTLITEYHGVEQRFNSLSEKLSTMEERFNDSLDSQMQRVKVDFSQMEQRLVDMRKEITQYEESRQIFTKSDDMIRKVEDAVQNFGGMLREAKDEARGIQKFMDDIEKIKDLRKTVEKELKAFEGRKGRLSSYENELAGIIGLTDMVTQKMDALEDKISKIDMVNTRIETLGQSYAGLEARISELREYEDTIAKNLESSHKADMLIKSMESRIGSFQAVVERSDKRIQKLTQYLTSIEENTLVLKSREQEIRDVKDKFGELEGLTAHIEKRIDQIHAMFQKMESMRSEIDSTDSRLKDMFSQTDRKMKQFADFVQAVENNNPISRQMKGDLPLGKNLNDGVIKTVRELSSRGWSSNDIAKKLLIDENSVRLIINTASV